MPNPPPLKKIGYGTTISADSDGYPVWTRLSVRDGHATFGEEEVRDLHYALTRIIAYYDARRAERKL